MIRLRARVPIPLLVAVWANFLLVIACSLVTGGPAPPAPDESEPGEHTRETTNEGEADFQEQQFSVDHEYWHSGFHVFLKDGSFFADENELTGELRYFVTIAVSFENLGDDEISYDAATAVRWDGNSAPKLLNSDLPRVPAGLASEGSLRFEVDEGFDPASASLIVGSNEVNRAQVPLGPQGGELVALAPKEPPISGELSMELIDMTFTSAELRADRPSRYSQVEAGKRALTLHFDATSRRSGNWSIQPQNFALVLPSGAAVGIDGSELASLPGAAEGLVTTDLSVRFLVDQPISGTYTLRLTPGEWFVGADGVTAAEFEFVLE